MSRSGARYQLWSPGEGPGYAFASGLWYPCPGAVASLAIGSNGQAHAQALFVATQQTFSHIGLATTVAATGAGVVDLGVYTDNGSGYPASLVQDVGPTTVTTGVGAISVAFAITLSPGLYWVAGVFSGATTQPSVQGTNANAFSIFGSGAAGGTSTVGGWVKNAVAATLPGTFPAGAAAQKVACLQLQV